MSEIIKTIQFGTETITIKTGKVARQASSVLVSTESGTVVMVNVVAKNEPTDASFFPLRVDYQEKTYAGGKIPGGFFKREGRPSEREILICRLIDRPIRPLFPKSFRHDVQITASLLSLDPAFDPDVLAMIGASAATALTGAPFNGPMAAARVGYIDGAYVLNPSQKQLKESALNLVVAGTADSVLMVESEADVLNEDIMLGAVMFGHQGFAAVIKAIVELKAEVGKPDWNWQAAPENLELKQAVASSCEAEIVKAYQIKDKLERQDALKALKDRVITELESEEIDAASIKNNIAALEKSIVRGRILAGELRIDGRDTKTVRNISTEVGTLPRTHGSSLFTRGETQVLATVTLGTERDAQINDCLLDGSEKDNYMLHYNFPPYCVGEVGMMSGPKRREIGHGKLAKRSLQAVLPTLAEFPYIIRSVCEVTESNGSSSMASVCSSSMALMDAGVPIKAPVAGIAMGLIKDENTFSVLTDILGDEDHLGDMDFKVAGTRDGITALQMDIKIAGITKDIMEQALAQAKDARLHILGIMEQTIAQSRSDLSEFAPSIIEMKINPDKIRDVIGKGGATIKSLTEGTEISIDIKDDGTVQIYASDTAEGEAIKKKIEALTEELEVGKIYTGKVVRIVDFGAFVNLLPGKDGLLHISQISDKRIENVTDVLQEDQQVTVKVTAVDRQGKVKLSMKEQDLVE